MDQQSKHLLWIVCLCAALIGLGLFALYGVFFTDTTAEAQKAVENKVFLFKKDDVESFAITAKGETTRLSYLTEAKNTGWRLVTPVQDYTNLSAVELILDALASVSWQEKIEGADADPRRFGLDKPAVIALVRLRNGQQHTLRLGSLTAIDGNDYIAIDGRPEVYRTRTPLRFAIEKNTFDLRSLLLLPVYSDQIEVIEAIAPGRHTHLRKGVDGSWRLNKPIATRADDKAVQKMLDAIEQTHITRFVSERATPIETLERGFDRPRLRLKLALRGYRHVEFLFVDAPPASDAPDSPDAARAQDANNATPKLLARRTDRTTIFELPASILLPFEQDSTALRDKHVTRFDPGSVAILDFRLDDGPLRIDRTVEGEGDEARISWELKGLYPKPFSEARVRSILGAFQQLTASAFLDGQVDLDALGLKSPRRAWILRDNRGHPIVTLTCGKSEGGENFLQLIDADGERQVVSVSDASLATLPRLMGDLESWDATRFLSPAMTSGSSDPGD